MPAIGGGGNGIIIETTMIERIMNVITISDNAQNTTTACCRFAAEALYFTKTCI